ncbi:tyrosine-type recombinase/integrase [Bradyrhizobium sp. SZCCHNS3051]|uniref:tyrosine-type recombinase/integrase n=1 Tax=Bradyrhizobium sp. SZCCHNS3051 TaxID=3057320 RepID=UPI002915FBC3|nr:tyrosine-type recombinase/integrase [Bradyrhizobium sp. SZCCHNS3051]
MDRENGKRRVRFRDRKTGFSTYLYGTPWSPEFMMAYAAALDGSKAKATAIVGAKRTVAGTINAVIVSYYASPSFKDLKASTQANRRNILERFRAGYGDLPAKGITRAVLDKIMGDRSNTPHAANNLMKVLRYLLDHAVTMNVIATNPTIGIRKYRKKSDGWHTWTEDEIAQYEKRHPINTRAGLALALLLYTGQRRSDVVTMGRQHISGDLIAVRQEKTGTPLMIPLHPELMKALDALPRSNLTFLLTEKGAPFTAAGFGNWMRDRCDEANLSHCSAHGLRKAAATRLANIGCSNEQIKAITGHRSDASLAPYTRAADQVRLARQAMARLVETDSEQKVVQHPIHAGPKRG